MLLPLLVLQGSSSTLPKLLPGLPDFFQCSRLTDPLCILVLLGYAITIHNGTFTWAQDLPPTLHR